MKRFLVGVLLIGGFVSTSLVFHQTVTKEALASNDSIQIMETHDEAAIRLWRR